MAEKNVWVGNRLTSYDNRDVNPTDGAAAQGIRVEEQVSVETAPSLQTHVLRLADIDTLVQGATNSTATSGLFANRPASGGEGDFYYAYDTGVMYSWDTETDAWVQVSAWNGFITGDRASRPAAGSFGRRYWAGDVNVEYFDNGIQWLTMNGTLFGTLANRPSAVTLGPNVFYFATDNSTLYYSNGATWSSIGGNDITGDASVSGNLVVDGAAEFGQVNGQVAVYQDSEGQAVLLLGTTGFADGNPLEITQLFSKATTSGTPATAFTLSTSSGYSYIVELAVTARRTGGVSGSVGDSAMYKQFAGFKNISGTVTQIGSSAAALAVESQAGWDCALSASGSDILVTVTGATNNNVKWFGTIRYTLVGA